MPFTLTGTATNGVQYTNLALSATIPVGQTTANVFIQPKPISVAGPTRTAILSLKGGPSYAVVSPSSDTVYIVDTNKPSIQVAVKDAQFYERTNDYGRFTLTRYGDTNVALSQVNVTFGGTATAGTQFYPASTSTNFNAGDVNVDLMVYPIYDGVLTGPLTVTATVGAATDGSYTVGSPSTSGAMTRVDADDPTETVIWSDSLSTDTSANWDYRFAAAPDPTPDYCVNAYPDLSSLPQIGTWPLDFSTLGWGIPPAPHTRDGSTKGLYMTVNKNDGVAAAAALNFYPKGQHFNGNYSFRFDMFLIENDTVSTTEYALFGLNHDGMHTNWFRNSTTTFTGVDATGWNFDGVFYDAESDGADLGQYVAYSSPTTTSINPTALVPGVAAEALTGVFKSPPWTPGNIGGGACANLNGSTTPIWADVELRQVNNVLSWYINHALIFAYTNTTAYTNGNVMLGYEDGYDSIGSSGGAVIYANARVVKISGPPISNVGVTGTNLVLTFSAASGNQAVPSQYILQQSTPSVTGPYTNTTATITSLGGGVFQAVKPAPKAPTFYRLKLAY